MKITHVNGVEVDTDKEADVAAEILEASESLRKLCFKYKRQFFLVADPRDDGHSVSFWSVESGALLVRREKKEEAGIEEVRALFTKVDMAVRAMSGGNLTLTNVSPI